MYVNPRTRVPAISQRAFMTRVYLHTSWDVFPPVRRALGFDSKMSPTGLRLEDLDCFLFWRWWLAGWKRVTRGRLSMRLTCFWFKPEISASWLAKMWEASISGSWQHGLFPVAASYHGWLKSLWNVGSEYILRLSSRFYQVIVTVRRKVNNTVGDGKEREIACACVPHVRTCVYVRACACVCVCACECMCACVCVMGKV